MFLESEFAFAGLRWTKLDMDRVVAIGRYGPLGEPSNWADPPDLSKVDEVGFVDLMPGSGHGSGGWVNVASFEFYGTTVKRAEGKNSDKAYKRSRSCVEHPCLGFRSNRGAMADSLGSERPARFQRQSTWRCADSTDR
jgi:hypothetical protein